MRAYHKITGRSVQRLSGILLLGLCLCLGCQSAGSPFRQSTLPPATAALAAAGPAAGESSRQPIAQVAFDETSDLTDQADPATSEAIANQGMIIAEQLAIDGVQANTLPSLESIALQNHPAIVEARARVSEANGQYVQAGLPFNPSLQYQSDEIGSDDASGLHSLRLSQQFITANKLGLAQQVAAQSVNRRRAELRRAELEVLTRVRIAFARSLIAQQRVELTNSIVQLAEQSVQSVDQLYQAQEVSRVALLQARVEAQQARIDAENAATALAASRRLLAAESGISELPASALVGDPTAGLSEAPWETLIDNLTSQSPELIAAGADLERARWALRLACAQVTPNVTVQAGAGVDASIDDTFASVQVSVPLPIRNRNEGNIRSARAGIASSMAATERVRLDLESRLADAVGRYRIARQRFQRLNEQVLPTAQESFELSRVAFEAEELSFLQFLTAQTTLITTRLQILDALLLAKEVAAEIDGLLVTLR